MHQTFYIDIDEEISSVVDRLNKSMSKENYFVVPKRALFLQSIVNLKILKRESEKLNKHIVIVTQDELGSSMASRSGIEVRSAVEDFEEINETVEDFDESDVEENDLQFNLNLDSEKDKQARLSGVGSAEFYAHNSVQNTNASKKKSKALLKTPTTTPRQQQRNAQINLKQNVLASKSVQAHLPQKPQVSSSSLYKKQLDPGKVKSLEKLFSHEESNQIETLHSTGNTKNFFLAFIVVCCIFIVGIAAYLVVPSAKISIEPEVVKKKVDLDLHGKNIKDVDGQDIPVQMINENIDLVLPYNMTGKKIINGKKAQMKVAIYNEYSSSAQTLIATTRLENTDGKIFRLVKNIVIPGTTAVGGETRPGVIEAEIVADAPGSQYNIESATFKIPGFADGPKFDKFYAKSVASASGGTDGSEEASGTVTQDDIDSAKSMAAAAFKEEAVEVLKNKLQDGEIALPQAQNIITAKPIVAAKVGSMAGSFNVTISGTLQALVFAEKDVKKVVQQNLRDDKQTAEYKEEISKIEYGTVGPDFQNATLELKTYAEIRLISKLNSEQIKKDLLGKKDEELSVILKKYPIKNANIEFNSSFVTRVPQYPQRVTVEIQELSE